jgi:hypothetical protein
MPHDASQALLKKLIDKTLVFVVDPAFREFTVAYGILQEPFDLYRGIAAFKTLDGDDYAEVFACQHVSNGDKAAVRFLAHSLEDRQACGLSPMRAGQGTATEIMKDDIVVIAIDDSAHIIRNPSVGVTSDHGVEAAIR